MGKLLRRLLMYPALLLLALICLLPVAVVFVNSTRSNSAILSQLSLIPGKDLVQNYLLLAQHIPIFRGLVNSFVISLPAMILSCYFGLVACYGFLAFGRFPLRNLLFLLVIFSILVPAQLGLIGFYQLNATLNLLDSYWPLVLPAIATGGTVFFLRQYMQANLPQELLDAARLEGAGELAVIHRIALPLMMPALVTMAIFNFVASWNNYLLPLILITSTDKYPLALMVGSLRANPYRVEYGAVYLVMAISLIPVIILYLLLSRFLIAGVTTAALKE